MLKWIGIALGAVFLLVAASGVYFTTIGNARITKQLRESPDGDVARRVMLVTLPSGRQVPVNFLREGDVVYAGADGPWWRQLRGEGVSVELLVRGDTLTGKARAIEGAPDFTREVFDRLRPDVPKWLPAWADAVLVEIKLDTPKP